MAVLDAIKTAVLRADGTSISAAFASTEQIAMEMVDLSNEVATDILRSHDWRDLTKVAQITGNGGQAYPLPADYDRMVQPARVDNPGNFFWGYEYIPTVNEWMRLTSGQMTIAAPGGWIMLGGNINFWPAPAGNAVFPYVSNLYARSLAGAEKSAFTQDDDAFVLDNRLLTLGLIWKWRAQKGMDYSEDMASYELALSQAMARDKGAYVIKQGRVRR